jgi:putative membrane protein
MLWIKTAHVFLVFGWFTGLFYVPRLFVNLAQVPEAGAERERLLGMARRLNRFTSWLSVGGIACGLLLWLYYGVGRGEGWIHAKVALVAALVGYQHLCMRHLRAFAAGRTPHSHTWYRWFNEVPTLLLIGILALVIQRPF